MNTGQSLGNTLTQPKAMLETSKIGDRFDATINQMMDLSARLNALANRISGNVPEPVAGGSTVKELPPSCFIRATDQRFETLTAEIDRAFSALARLEQFA